MKGKNCWEIKGCGLQTDGEKTGVRGTCPAALPSKFDGINGGERSGRFCWSIAGTLCRGDVQGVFAEKISNCLDCGFLQVRDEEGLAFILTVDDAEHELVQAKMRMSKKIADIARAVFIFMIKKDIPITPENYKVWFEYHHGGNEELEKVVREKMTNGQAINQELTENLYNQYFGDPDRKKIIALVETHASKILKEIIENVLVTHNDTTEYSKKLKKYSEHLNEVSDIKEVKRVIRNIINDTKKAEASNLKLQKKLEEIKLETQDLKKAIDQKEKDLLKDPLTGLYNRRALQRRLRELCTDFKENGSLFSVIMIDINLFKQFNDKYGHMIGDEALQIVSATLEENIKGKDFVGRYGGDEFILLLPMTTLYSATIVAENVKKAVSEKRLKFKSTGKSIEQLGICLGVSQIHPGDTIESITARADAALLMAKKADYACIKTEKDLS